MMYILGNSNNKFAPHKYFHGDDNIELYLDNQSKLGTAWEYTGTEHRLTYDWNKDGFRHPVDLDNVDWDNAIAVHGCSHILGTGNFFENTVPAILQSYYKDYTVVNMGVAGAGVDHTAINLLTVYLKYKPKYNIVCWPGDHRFVNIDIDNGVVIPNRITPGGVKSQSLGGFNIDYIVSDDLLFKNDYYRSASELVPNTVFVDSLKDRITDIPGVMDLYESLNGCRNVVTDFNWTDQILADRIADNPGIWARDLKRVQSNKLQAHWGPRINRLIADYIVQQSKHIIAG